MALKTMMGIITDEQMEKFEKIFKIDIRKFVTPVTGFDIVMFNNWLKIPDDESISNYLTEHYGKAAMEFVKELI